MSTVWPWACAGAMQGGRARLAKKPRDLRAIGEQLAAQQLHRRRLAGLGVAALVDLAHRAASEHVAELEGADALTGIATRPANAERALELGAQLLHQRV